MASVCLYLHVHQPLRVRKYRVFDVGNDHNYFEGDTGKNADNKSILKKVANKSYLPTNKVFLDLLKKHPKFRLSLSMTGVLLEQLDDGFGDVLESFQQLVDTGRVEILAETYHHSLAFFYSLSEFEHQVEKHRKLVKKLFGINPKVFRNTELAYNNDLASWADKKGYKAILAEGWDSFLGWRSPNFVYSPHGTEKIKLLLKNYKLSDDIAFRFSEKSWPEWPMTAKKFASWVSAINGNGQVVNLFMDYETFGEHQWEDKGIFEFLSSLPDEILKHPDNDFITPSEAAKKYDSVDYLDVPHVVTWADTERDLSAWTGNAIQNSAIDSIYGLEKRILATKNRKLIEDWRRLQTSDHFYYMCTKWFADGDVHKYFSPYDSPYDAFINYMNAVKDLELRINDYSKTKN